MTATTTVKGCEHRRERVTAGGGLWCEGCGRETDASGAPLPPEPIHTASIDGLDVWALASRTDIGRKELLVTANVTGAWIPELAGPYPRHWAAGEVAVVTMVETGWQTYLGAYQAVYADDLELTADVARAVRFLSGQRPMDYTALPDGEREAIAEALGLRLPRRMFKGGRVEKYGRYETFSAFVAENLSPKPPPPLNLRK